MIQLSRKTLQDFGGVAGREWLETNGTGGFACSSVIGLNTRRYHGLLTAALRPPTGRVVLLSKFEETLFIDGRRHDLSTNQYAGAVHPQGYTYLEEFRLDLFPIAVFNVDGVRIEKHVFMVHGQNTTVVQYRIGDAGARKVSLELRPLIAFRDYHGLTHENGGLDRRVDVHHSAYHQGPVWAWLLGVVHNVVAKSRHTAGTLLIS